MKKLNTTEKITIKENKTLKLNNVLIRQVSENELMDVSRITYMMESYIKTKGNSTVGPLINYSKAEVGEDGKPKMIMQLIVQLKNPISNVEKPYEIKPQLRVTNCLFSRFTEKEEKIQFAYSKLAVHAFENEIKLKGDTYTVFVNRKDDNIVADIFMPIEKAGDEIESL
ncbi:MAG: hypothetical protein AB6733_20575 [Clostridiaceae bacterium]